MPSSQEHEGKGMLAHLFVNGSVASYEEGVHIQWSIVEAGWV